MVVIDPAWPLSALEPTRDDPGSVWVAVDESGSTGENLGDPQGVFAHAAVRIDDETAEEVLVELRQRAGARQSPEVKFKQFTKQRGLYALAEALAPDGALSGRVIITVADKKFLITSKMIDLLVEEVAHEHGIDLYTDGSARGMAVTLFRDGPRGLGRLWEPLTAAFVSLARATQRGGGDKETVESFFGRLEQARWHCHRRSVEDLLKLLLTTRPHAEELVGSTELRHSGLFPGLDPLITMLPLTLHYVYAAHGPVRLLHDEHKIFTPEFTRDLLWHLWNPYPGLPRDGKIRVAEFWTGRSHQHPSIQLADLAAAAGRVVTEAQLGQPSSAAAEALTDVVLPLIRDCVVADPAT